MQLLRSAVLCPQEINIVSNTWCRGMKQDATDSGIIHRAKVRSLLVESFWRSFPNSLISLENTYLGIEDTAMGAGRPRGNSRLENHREIYPSPPAMSYAPATAAKMALARASLFFELATFAAERVLLSHATLISAKVIALLAEALFDPASYLGDDGIIAPVTAMHDSEDK